MTLYQTRDRFLPWKTENGFPKKRQLKSEGTWVYVLGLGGDTWLVLFQHSRDTFLSIFFKQTQVAHAKKQKEKRKGTLSIFFKQTQVVHAKKKKGTSQSSAFSSEFNWRHCSPKVNRPVDLVFSPKRSPLSAGPKRSKPCITRSLHGHPLLWVIDFMRLAILQGLR